MTKPTKATELGLEPHYKIRVVIPGSILHLASTNEPEPIYVAGHLTGIIADWIEDPDYGDTLGFIEWDAVKALTWRWSE